MSERANDAVRSEDVGNDVLSFYRDLPFNYRETPWHHAETIRKHNQIKAYPPLAAQLRNGATLLDVGCGAGWLCLSAAHHHGCRVTGIDFNQVAVDRARAVAMALRVPAEFETADLFRYVPAGMFDIVTSVGVLHHTHDCLGALDRLCRLYVRPGGHAFIGLYHHHGRRPFLEHFRKMRASGASEEAMFDRYRQLHASLDDETHLRSWFRDQVLHPHETQHTLSEVLPVLGSAGMRLVSTSINRFQPIGDVAEVVRLEPSLERIGEQRLELNQYYPGFFVFMAQKNA